MMTQVDRRSKAMARICMIAIGFASSMLACTDSGHEVVDRLDCNRCHASEYEAEPVHTEKDFPRTCYACHGLSDWSDADEDHNRFAIDREPHAGYDCQDCHLSVDDRKDITCIDCHWHSESRTNPFHLGNGEYEYKPAACLQCHRTGR